MMVDHIVLPQAELRDFCQRYHIKHLALFGSVLGDKWSGASDVDVLVIFDPDHIPGWEIVAIEDELSALLGYQIDLRTYDDLSPHFRDTMPIEVIYGAP